MQRVRDLVAKLDAEVPRGEGTHPGDLPAARQRRGDGQGAHEPAGREERPGGRERGASAAPGGAPAISKDIKIVADLETNSLIITGPREEYEAVEGVIKKLDIPRRMSTWRP